jgi:hypothetical protein
MRNGTCNFISIEKARAYYAEQSDDADAALAEERIAIGAPAVTFPTIRYADSTGRYWTCEASEDAQRFIAMMKECGYRVFINPAAPYGVTWCHYTDGTRIGYAQWSRGDTSVGTVHMPSHSVGTGFKYADSITPETLRDALHCHAPGWASLRDAASVRKYANWDAFHNADSFKRQSYEV